MKKIIIIASAIAAGGFLLAGCGVPLAGNAVVASSVVTVTPTVTVQSTITPTPTTHSTTPTTPPPVRVTQAPSTVTQAPSTIIQAPASSNTAAQQVTADHSSAESVTGNWLPQMGSYTDSPSAMHRFQDLQQAGYSPIMIWSGDYSSFASSNYFVIMLPRTFASASAVNNWLDSEGIQKELGFAKFLSHSSGSDGSTVER